jgi:hypothetical protein
MRSPMRLVYLFSFLTALGVPTAWAQDPCQPRTDGPGKECFVSPSGNDANAGTIVKPFRTIAKGVSVLVAGDILNLRHAVYVEPVVVAGKNGTAAQPIVIRAYPGEAAYIDGSVPEFRRPNNTDWEPASLYDPEAHPDEYVSVTTFTDFIRGVFLDRNPYTRLITYSKLKDLRANNETFAKITDPSDPRPGPWVVDCDNSGNCVPKGFRFPWVYMGPGIWIDRNPSPTNPQKVHIRLSHTHNNVPGLGDYTGEVDPRKVQLALSPEFMTTLCVQNSSHVHFEGLTIRYGGDYTVSVKGTTSVVFDHVRFRTSTYGASLGNASGTIFRHCEFNGGMPTWYFRTDRKSEYMFLDENGTPVPNNLGKQTVRGLFLGGGGTDTTIHNCEFFNAHDMLSAGNGLVFHHNWINNMNDEGVILDAHLNAHGRIYQNVFLKTLSPISFAGGKVTGPFYIYRNLVDVRKPTAGYRPRYTGDVDVWRYGNTFKSNYQDGPYDVFQNSFLVYAQKGQASYLHYRSGGSHPRRSFNNIFVAVNDSESDRAISFLPSPSFPAQIDGNLYHRIGAATRPLLRYLGYEYQGGTFNGGSFAGLADLYASQFFVHSQSQYAPGYEASSLEADPQFESIGADGRFRDSDDLRLSITSPARAAGIMLPPDLAALDAEVVPPSGTPDIGCYPYGAGPLQVGVDGRRSYPDVP